MHNLLRKKFLYKNCCCVKHAIRFVSFSAISSVYGAIFMGGSVAYAQDEQANLTEIVNSAYQGNSDYDATLAAALEEKISQKDAEIMRLALAYALSEISVEEARASQIAEEESYFDSNSARARAETALHLSTLLEQQGLANAAIEGVAISIYERRLLARFRAISNTSGIAPIGFERDFRNALVTPRIRNQDIVPIVFSGDEAERILGSARSAVESAQIRTADIETEFEEAEFEREQASQPILTLEVEQSVAVPRFANSVIQAANSVVQAERVETPLEPTLEQIQSQLEAQSVQSIVAVAESANTPLQNALQEFQMLGVQARRLEQQFAQNKIVNISDATNQWNAGNGLVERFEALEQNILASQASDLRQLQRSNLERARQAETNFEITGEGGITEPPEEFDPALSNSLANILTQTEVEDPQTVSQNTVNDDFSFTFDVENSNVENSTVEDPISVAPRETVPVTPNASESVPIEANATGSLETFSATAVAEERAKDVIQPQSPVTRPALLSDDPELPPIPSSASSNELVSVNSQLNNELTNEQGAILQRLAQEASRRASRQETQGLAIVMAAATPSSGARLTEAELRAMLAVLSACWVMPNNDSLQDGMSVSLGVSLDRNGYVLPGTIQLVNSTAASSVVQAAQSMLQDPACQPFDLPADKWESWKRIVLTIQLRAGQDS